MGIIFETSDVPRPALRRAQWAHDRELDAEVRNEIDDIPESPGMRESTVERSLVRRVAGYGGMALKWKNPWVSGVPDRVVMLPGGRAYFVELKAPGGVQTPLQRKMAKNMAALGHWVPVLDSPEAVDAWLVGAANSPPTGDLREELRRAREALAAIRAHCMPQPGALATAIVATCDSVLGAAP
jgi:hypothetical protein